MSWAPGAEGLRHAHSLRAGKATEAPADARVCAARVCVLRLCFTCVLRWRAQEGKLRCATRSDNSESFVKDLLKTAKMEVKNGEYYQGGDATQPVRVAP